jgi:alanine-glyoxylate transaminase/serine-glyoxylate transaminase/serine-pyruvate transaminase
VEEFAGLKHLFQTQEPVSIVPAPAAMLREIGLRATIEQRVLVPVSGEESAALADTAESLGAEVVRLMVHPGESIEPELVLRWIREPAVDSIALVHSEPSTGVLAPLEALAAIVQRHPDLVLFVDATGSLGATPLRTDAWGLDFVLAASDGPLGLPPGVAFGTASPRLLARTHGLQGRGVLLDYRTHHTAAAEGTPVAELPPGLGPRLRERLRELDGEGLEAEWRRYAEAAEQLARWAAGRPDLTLVAKEERRSPTVSCFRLAESHSATGVADRLSGLGWTVGITLMEGWVGLQVEHMSADAIARMPELLLAMEQALQAG